MDSLGSSAMTQSQRKSAASIHLTKCRMVERLTPSGWRTDTTRPGEPLRPSTGCLVQNIAMAASTSAFKKNLADAVHTSKESARDQFVTSGIAESFEQPLFAVDCWLFLAARPDARLWRYPVNRFSVLVERNKANHSNPCRRANGLNPVVLCAKDTPEQSHPRTFSCCCIP